jgi:orotate phosphoribosyltransferase
MILPATRAFLRRQFKIGVVKIDTKVGFRMALHDKQPQAPLSPIYLSYRTPNNKNGPLTADDVETIARALLIAAGDKRIRFDAVAGIPRAGTPFAKVIARLTGAPYIRMLKRSNETRAVRVRTEVARTKSNGARVRVLLVDDLLTGADSKWLAIDALRRARFEVVGVAVYLDREQGGTETLVQSGIPVARVVGMSQMLSFYYEEGFISPEDYHIIRCYLKG